MKKIVMILFAGLLVSAGLQAQKVYIKNNKVILDLTEAAGMPVGSVTDVSKTARFNELMDPDTGVGAPSATNVLWHSDNQESDDVKGNINARVFQTLEVAPKDMNTSGGMDGTGTMTMNWAVAFNGCINSDYDSGGWRLPTQRELMMIWIFNDALKIALQEVSPSGTDAALSSTFYWSATEYGMRTWYMSVDRYGYIGAEIKTNLYRVRCVREVN